MWTAGRGIVMGFPESFTDCDPVVLFNSWFEAARKTGMLLPEAMTLASSSPDGRPSARMVLLKSADESGFVFFTSYESRKAEELDANPFASLLFHWPLLQRQVRVEGRIERVSREESEAYFKSRPRASRIGAWASKQSSRLSHRNEMRARVKKYEERFHDQDIPLPEHWGGYRVRPERIEFWQGRPFRLHDRVIFENERGEWHTHRLYP